MAVYYLDSSAVVKAYASEPGSQWVQNLGDLIAGHLLHTSQITGPEVIAALFRKVRMNSIRQAVAVRTAHNFRQTWEQRYQVVAITPLVIEHAMLLAEQHTLRGYEAVHLAAALHINGYYQQEGLPPLTFVSADLAQLAVAAALGLPSDNPDQHP